MGPKLTQAEGFILGIGAKMFTIAGPVIVYGVSAGVVYGRIYWMTKSVLTYKITVGAHCVRPYGNYFSKEALTSMIRAEGSPQVLLTVMRIFSAVTGRKLWLRFLIKLSVTFATVTQALPLKTSTV